MTCDHGRLTYLGRCSIRREENKDCQILVQPFSQQVIDNVHDLWDRFSAKDQVCGVVQASVSRGVSLVCGLDSDAVILAGAPYAPEEVVVDCLGSFHNGAIVQGHANFS